MNLTLKEGAEYLSIKQLAQTANIKKGLLYELAVKGIQLNGKLIFVRLTASNKRGIWRVRLSDWEAYYESLQTPKSDKVKYERKASNKPIFEVESNESWIEKHLS